MGTLRDPGAAGRARAPYRDRATTTSGSRRSSSGWPAAAAAPWTSSPAGPPTSPAPTRPSCTARSWRCDQAGKTAQEILDAFVAKYGEKALMAPKPEGFNLAGYLLPGVGHSGGGRERWSRSSPDAGWRWPTRRRPAASPSIARAGAGPHARRHAGGAGAAPTRAGRGGGLMLAEVLAAALVGAARALAGAAAALLARASRSPGIRAGGSGGDAQRAWRSRRSRRSSSTGRPASCPTRTTSSSRRSTLRPALEALRAEEADEARPTTSRP